MTAMSDDDALLLAAWHRHRDVGAFQSLCERHAGLVEAACRRQGSRDIPEAVQAVFLVLARRAGDVAGATLGGWLTVTAQRVVRDQHRAAARRRRHEQEAAMEQTRQRASASAEPLWLEARQHLDAALASLSAGRREAVLRYYLEGKPQAQVAAELGCSVDAVKTRVHQGLEHLRAFFARRGVRLATAVLAAGLASEADAGEPGLAAACTQAAAVPAVAAPGAVALAQGVMTAMLVRTAALAAAGFVIAATCLGVALVAGAGSPPSTAPAMPPAQPRQALGAAPVAGPAWAAATGVDQYGAWADLRFLGVTQRFRWIAPGTFSMGSPPAEQDTAVRDGLGRAWVVREVPHQVTLSAGFWMADTVCTQAMWRAVTGADAAPRAHAAQDPVDWVSWNDCQRFLATLNAHAPGGGFRLPTEAQWEYACRAGTTTAFSFGQTITTAQVNFDGTMPFGAGVRLATSARRLSCVPVRSLPANAWGLFEMHGNVNQWCSDFGGGYSGQAERDPAGPPPDHLHAHVYRGGDFSDNAANCRSANRRIASADLRTAGCGFRIIATGTIEPQRQEIHDAF